MATATKSKAKLRLQPMGERIVVKRVESDIELRNAAETRWLHVRIVNSANDGKDLFAIVCP